ncbi:hypothetical protein ACWFRF_20895 [Nocardia sp. NPDC055165]
MFDPTEHSIAQVLDYLVDADAVETGRVLALERKGLARMQILTAVPVSLGGRPPIQKEANDAKG